MAAQTGKKYVIGKGRLFFDRFLAGTKTLTGERYLGNSPELTSTIAQDTLDHIDADEGLNVKDEQITVKNDLNGAFKLDSIETANVALWYGGDIENETIVAAAAVVDADQLVKRGLHYQIGVSTATPSGTRKIDNVAFAVVTAAVIPTDPDVVTIVDPADVPKNFDIDLERARFYVESDAPLVPAAVGAKIRVTYDQEGVTREIVIAEGQEIRGALRFLSKNPVGDQRDYYWPYVKITSNGDYSLKGDTWQEMSFTYEVLKKDNATARCYIDGVAQV